MSLDKLVEDVVRAIEPNASKELLQKAKQKANEIFHKDVNDFLDDIEILIESEKNDLETESEQ